MDLPPTFVFEHYDRLSQGVRQERVLVFGRMYAEPMSIRPNPRYSVSPDTRWRAYLPPGMRIDEFTGSISGSPKQVCNARVEYKIIANNQSGSCEFKWGVIVRDREPCFQEREGESMIKYGVDLHHQPTALAPLLMGGDNMPCGVEWEIETALTEHEKISGYHTHLPKGLFLDRREGVINGSPRHKSSSYKVKLTAWNTGRTHKDTHTLKIVVVDRAPQIHAYTHMDAVYMIDIQVEENMPIMAGGDIYHHAAFTCVPDLPQGLSIDQQSGRISGAPQVLLKQTSFTITAKNDGGIDDCVIYMSVNDRPPHVDNYDTYPRYIISQTYFDELSRRPRILHVERANDVFFTAGPGSRLPPGLKLAPSGCIVGTPTQLCHDWPYTIIAQNSGGRYEYHVSICVVPDVPHITGYSDVHMIFDLRAMGSNHDGRGRRKGGGDAQIVSTCKLAEGTDPRGLVFQITPTLPDGMFLDSHTGHIAGYPSPSVHLSHPQTFRYIITATNAGGSSNGFPLEITITPQAQRDNPPMITHYTRNTCLYRQGVPIETNSPTLRAGFDVVDRWSCSEPLPDGLNLDIATGKITGKPLQVTAPKEYVIWATNSGGNYGYKLRIQITPAAPDGVFYEDLVFDLDTAAVIGNRMPSKSSGGIAVSFSGKLPHGLDVVKETGRIVGFPTYHTTPEAQKYTIRVTNDAGFFDAEIHITIKGCVEENYGTKDEDVFDYNIFIMGDHNVGKKLLIEHFKRHSSQLTGVEKTLNSTHFHNDEFKCGGGHFQNPDGTGSDLYAHFFRIPAREYASHNLARKLAHAHGVLLVFDVTDNKTFESLSGGLKFVRAAEKLSQRSIPTMLVANKIDLLDRELWSTTKMHVKINGITKLPPGTSNARLVVEYLRCERTKTGVVVEVRPSDIVYRSPIDHIFEHGGAHDAVNTSWGGDQSFEVALPNDFLQMGGQAGHTLVFRVLDGDSHVVISESKVEGGQPNSFFTHQLGRLDVEVNMSTPGTTLSLSVVKSSFANNVANYGKVQKFRSENHLMHMRVSSVDDRKSKHYGGETVYQVFSGMMMKIHNYMHGIDAPNSNWHGHVAPEASPGYARSAPRNKGKAQSEDTEPGAGSRVLASNANTTQSKGFFSNLFGKSSSKPKSPALSVQFGTLHNQTGCASSDHCRSLWLDVVPMPVSDPGSWMTT